MTDSFEIKQPKESLLEKICTVITDSGTPRHSLQAIVEMIAGQYGVDVCSVYLLDAARKRLILRATIGLNPQSIDRISMGIDEGLTGLVLETMGPVFVRQPEQHARYKYFEHSGEEAYRTFLGIPLVFHQQTFGVLVLQTIDDQSIIEEDIAIFSTIASQIAATAAYSGLMNDLQKERMERRSDMAQALPEAPVPRPAPKSREHKSILKGLPVSAGFAEGQAQYLVHGIGFDQIRTEKAENTRHEKARLQRAFKQAIQQIRDLSSQITDIPADDAAIVEAHRMLLSDNNFQARIMAQVDAGFRAESALKLAVQAYLEHFFAMDDPYMRERGSDIEDLGRRVLRNLLGVSGFKGKVFKHPTIVIASDISAVDLISLRQPNLRGIVLAKGGKTSHAVILAKSFEVPMIIGLKGVFEAVGEREFLIVDGNSGLLFRNPPQVIKDEYRRLRIEKEKINQQLGALRDQKATTIDGVQIDLGANIGLLSDLELVDKYGADYIGLYRTEFPFLVRKDFPSEQEQLDLYQMHPAVVATIYEVIGICRSMDKPVSICGEAASNAQCAYLFVGMGAENLSMNPAAIPLIKDFVGHISREHARETLEQVLAMEQTEQIAAFMENTCTGLGTVCEPPKHTVGILSA